jgi:hypothetical protein
MARENMVEDILEAALNLKHKFFKYGTFRLASGIDLVETLEGKLNVVTESFVI